MARKFIKPLERRLLCALLLTCNCSPCMSLLTTPQTIVDLDSIINGHEQTMELCVDAMQKRGWILVRLDEKLRSASQTARECLQHFFNKNDVRDESREDRLLSMENEVPIPFLFPGHPLLGYDSNDPTRQAIRILTGSELQSQTLPESMVHPVKKLAETVDSKLLDISRNLCPPLFGLSLEDMEECEGIPFFVKDQSNYALMEAAYYHNRDDTKEVVCSAHFDPGLFSLNVLASEPGLQFKDEHSKWHDMDPSLGVLWTGAAAVEIHQFVKPPNSTVCPAQGLREKVSPGIHRVVVPHNKLGRPRLSVWSEICTQSQIFFDNDVLPKDATVEGSKIYVPNIFSRNGKPYIVPIKSGSLLETMRLVQSLEGLPMSKMMRTPLYNEDGEVIDIR